MIKKATNVQYGYTIEGNTIQDGVPSPQNPVILEGTGDRTENLFVFPFTDYLYCSGSGQNRTVMNTPYKRASVFKIEPNTTYTFSGKRSGAEDTYGRLFVFSEKPVPGVISTHFYNFRNDSSITFTTESNEVWCLVQDDHTSELDINYQMMLNPGTEALPYKPYGYRLNISSSGENLATANTAYTSTSTGLLVEWKKGSSEMLINGTSASSNSITFATLELDVGTYTLSVTGLDETGWNKTGFYLAGVDTVRVQGVRTYTITEPTIAKLQFVVMPSDISYENRKVTIMYTKTPTPLPYKPYIEPTKANIYLGEVETTRKIKKLVLTGEEASWHISGNFFFNDDINPDYLRTSNHIVYCTHYQGINNVTAGAQVGDGECAFYSLTGVQRLYIKDSNRTTTASFMSYLASQYANGTPVTVWYVLAEPETTVVNEPLMKIGNYIDTINNTQSGIPISTNNLTVNTTIPPSKIDITSTATWVPIPYNKYNTETISTIAPIDFLSNGQNITVGLKGNAEQLEIPSPDNPVMPQGTGERTGNLFSGEFVQFDNVGGIGSTYTYFYIPEDFTLTLFAKDTHTVPRNAYLGITKDGGQSNGGYTWAIEQYKNVTQGDIFTVKSEEKGYHYISMFNKTASTFNWILEHYYVMLNTGSNPIPYEPYGYKIPISSANTTTPVYLGEVESTRRIKKLVLTGDEIILRDRERESSWRFFTDRLISAKDSTGICSHFENIGTNDVNNSDNIGFSIFNNAQFGCRCPKSIADTATDFKSYLAAQYTAGTPVTVWYVLAEPEKRVDNEPLMKIGEYVDEVSGITIPTTKGANTLSVNTSVQPSNVQLSISGWVPHNNIKEYKNNAWMATSWEGFRDIVRAGNGPTRYPIGTKLYETWGDDTSNAWIIVDYDNSNYSDPDISALGYTHNVVLYEEKINYLKIFDNAEAWLYVESVLPAGTYRFTIPNYDATYGGNKTYIFTSTVDVPIGGQLTLSWPYQQNPVSVSAYTTNTSTTALFTATLTEWDGTTTSEDLGTIKLAMTDSDSTYGKLNHIHRARYGSNNYYQSGIRQWMNADATANNWWKPTNIFDRPYSNRNTDGGLYLMDEDFRKVIAAPNITCVTNNIFETGTSVTTAFKLQTQYTIRDKIFLPTHTELNLSSTPNIGTVFSQYTNAGNDDRIKYRKDNGNAYYYWFRTPSPSVACNVRYVVSSGALSSSGARDTFGAVRACIIQ